MGKNKNKSAYILLCAALDAQDEAARLHEKWKRFVAKYPEYANSVMGDKEPIFMGVCRRSRKETPLWRP